MYIIFSLFEKSQNYILITLLSYIILCLCTNYFVRIRQINKINNSNTELQAKGETLYPSLHNDQEIRLTYFYFCL